MRGRKREEGRWQGRGGRNEGSSQPNKKEEIRKERFSEDHEEEEHLGERKRKKVPAPCFRATTMDNPVLPTGGRGGRGKNVSKQKRSSIASGRPKEAHQLLLPVGPDIRPADDWLTGPLRRGIR